MLRKALPPGFRFHPTDVELVLYYLKRKVMGKKLHYEAIAEVNIYKFSPWDLPDKSCLKSKDLEWFFFCPREKKYASGVRVKRATENGYWKTTGRDRTILYNGKTVGFVKTLIFHFGHAPKGERTDWVIHEYRIIDDELAAAGLQDTYVLCKVFKKNGAGPKNGAQYGAPFNEADWVDDNVDGAENHDISLATDGPSLTGLLQTEEQDSPRERGLFAPGNSSGLLLIEEGPSPSACGQTSELAADLTDDEILHMLAPFTDEDMVLSYENGINQKVGPSSKGMKELVPCFDGHDIFNGLGDLDTWGQMNEGRLDSSGLQNDVYFPNILPQDNSTYIELDDLLPPLDCSNGVASADQSSLGTVLGAPANETMQQHYSGVSFADMGQHASCVNELPLLLQGSYGTYNCLDVLQMVDHQIYQGTNAPNGLDFTFGQQEKTDYPTNLERGSQLLLDPAQTAALSYNPSGGSSIHIKAEVTHGAGECTNEALSVMMGGSGSCWRTLLPCAPTLLFFIFIPLPFSHRCTAVTFIKLSCMRLDVI